MGAIVLDGMVSYDTESDPMNVAIWNSGCHSTYVSGFTPWADQAGELPPKRRPSGLYYFELQL